MDREFIHSLDDGKYYLEDFLKQKKISTNSRGRIPPTYKPSISGVASSKDRQMHINFSNSISYTPHQNKYFGYCQCPMEKVKRSFQEIQLPSESTRIQSYIQPINLTNCFNKPKTPKHYQTCNERKENKVKKRFQSNPSYLCGNLLDASQVVKSGSIEKLNYRIGTKQIKKPPSLKQDTNFRFTCRILNDKKVRSPPLQLLQKYNIIDKINKQIEKYKAKKAMESIIHRIQPFQYSAPMQLSHHTYQSLDQTLEQQIKQRAFLSLSQR